MDLFTEKLLETIKRKCAKSLVTVDTLIEEKSYNASSKIIVAIKTLQDEGKITTMSCCNGGRFETQILIPGEEVIAYVTKPKKSYNVKPKHINTTKVKRKAK